MTIDSAEEAMSAAPTPWSALAVIRTVPEDPRPAIIEAAVRIAKPITNILRCPIISDSLPPSSNSAPNTITYALKIHCKSDCENPNCCCIAGSAIPMIDVSIMIRNCASESSASAFHRCRSCVAIFDSCTLLLFSISYPLVVFLVFMANSPVNGYIATQVYNCKIQYVHQVEFGRP
jgi:hypothetical protein